MSTPDANGWMPIETAPRDGTELLLWTTTRGSDDEWYVDQFCEGEHVNGPQIGEWLVEAKCWRLAKIGTPTHWHPLPKPPVDGASQ